MSRCCFVRFVLRASGDGYPHGGNVWGSFTNSKPTKNFNVRHGRLGPGSEFEQPRGLEPMTPTPGWVSASHARAGLGCVGPHARAPANSSPRRFFGRA
mmetsp:Transcript_148544/g.475563  ORF Transcript_148544/g.475563 Transcript_148544/m.475563 type:complete len:98 (-) Transcript_148544:38-331(-)